MEWARSSPEIRSRLRQETQSQEESSTNVQQPQEGGPSTNDTVTKQSKRAIIGRCTPSPLADIEVGESARRSPPAQIAEQRGNISRANGPERDLTPALSPDDSVIHSEGDTTISEDWEGIGAQGLRDRALRRNPPSSPNPVENNDNADKELHEGTESQSSHQTSMNRSMI